MQVSILIPTFNRQKYLKRCVESIQKHTAMVYEIIFINNGLTRGGSKWLGSHIPSTNNSRLIEAREAKNDAQHVNEALHAACGDLIVLLHNDVVVTDQWFSRISDLLGTHSNVACVGPMSNHVDGIQAIGHPVSLAEDQVESFADEFGLRNRYRRVSVTQLSDICIAFSRKNITKIGGFDEHLSTPKVMIEDLCLRLRLAGFEHAIAADVFIHHADSHKPQNDQRYGGHPWAEDRRVFIQKWNYHDLDSATGRNLLVLKTIEKGITHHHAGLTLKAAEILSEGIRYASDYRPMAINLAKALAKVGHHRQALKIIEDLRHSTSVEPQLLELTGYCQYGCEQYDSAEESAERLLSVMPESAAALNLKGLVAFQRGDKKNAAKMYQRAIASDPGYGPAFKNLGILMQESGHLPETLELLEKGVVLSAAEEDAAACYHSAIEVLKAYDRAETVFREAMVLHPHHKQLIYYLIDVLLKLEKYPSAMECIKLAVARFGGEDGILDAALKICPKVGPKTIEPRANRQATVSLCMITKNEEAYLARCLLSADAIVDEIVVIDTGSTDRTVDIAMVFGARVSEIKWDNDFSAARNVSLAKASGDWILVLDADEVISTTDDANFRKLLPSSDAQCVAYKFCTRNYTNRVNLIGWKPNDGLYIKEEAGCGWTASEKVRLFPNHPEIRFQYPVHELVEPSLKQKGIVIKRCNIPIHHYGKLSQKTRTAKKMPYYRLGKKKMADLEGDPGAIRELAVQAGIVGNHHEAIDLWKRFISLQPNICDGWVNIGASYTQVGNYDKALEASEKALLLDSQKKEAHYNYGISQLYLGCAEKAVDTLERLLQHQPDYLPAAFMLSAAHSCNGMKAKGLKGFEHLKKSAIGRELSFRCLDLARCLISRNLMDYAILLLEVAIECHVVSGEASTLLLKIRQLKKTAGESERLKSISSSF